MTKAAPQLETGEGSGAAPLPALAIADAASHNLAGQKLGRKGRDTRDRIIAAAVELIYCSPPETQISLSAVARQASLGMTSLYNYFSDLPELLLALLEGVMVTAEESYLALMRTRWPNEELVERCYQFVSGYHGFWTRHTRILHLRNSLSDDGDQRMIDQRVGATQPIIRRIVEQMDGDPRAPRSPEFAMATVLMIGIERSVTISTDRELPMLIAEDIQHDSNHFLRPCARLMEMAIWDMRRGKS